MAYIAKMKSCWTVVVDSSEGCKFGDEITDLTFSPDSQHLFYRVREHSKPLVLDGRVVKKNVYEACFSPNSQHLAYVLQSMKYIHGQHVITRSVEMDGKVGLEYLDASHLRFSPDSKYLAYEARKGNWSDETNRRLLVVGSQETREYEYIGHWHFADSRHLKMDARIGKNEEILEIDIEIVEKTE